MADLGEYLRTCGQQRWQWGVYDCCTFLADWIVLRGGADPMRGYRGRYSDEASSTAILQKAGGLVPLWTEALGEPSDPDTPPEPGDVAILEAWGHEGGGIWTGKNWVIRSPRGWVATRQQTVKAIWRG